MPSLATTTLAMLGTVALSASVPHRHRAAAPLPAVVSTAVSADADKWKPLKEQLDAWVFTENFGFTVGDATGPLFEYTHGNFSLTDSKCELASTSKWPLAMMFVGLVNDGTIDSLDDPANKYVPWWTKDPSDLKSKITLRQLLSFTSGFGSGSPGQENTTETCMDAPSKYPGITSYDACAEQIYNYTKLTGTPGKRYTYNSVHLQLAGSVALAAMKTGDIQDVVKKYLLEPYNMSSTTCANPSLDRPELAVCMETVGADYGNFLGATLSHSVLSEALVQESEKDYTTFLKGYSLYGDYGFGHFLECYDSIDGFTDDCKAAQVHADPGAFGYYPLIDRKNGYYMQVVAYENGQFYPRSGIPEYLRLAAKPLVDAIITGDPAAANEFGHHTPALNALSIADINYVAGCYAHPESCA